MMDMFQHALAMYPNEAAGYIKDGTFYPCENVAADPLTSFKVDSGILLLEPDVIVHSHPIPLGRIDWNPKAPSYDDQLGQLATAVEWCIIPTDGTNCDEPVYWGNPKHRPPLIGREYIPCAQDCLALCRDWLYADRALELPDIARRQHWYFDGERLIDDHWEAWGGTAVAESDLQRGDIMFMQIRSDTTNHLGIYLGDGTMLHHKYDCLSMIEPVDRWLKHTVRFARYGTQPTELST